MRTFTSPKIWKATACLLLLSFHTAAAWQPPSLTIKPSSGLLQRRDYCLGLLGTWWLSTSSVAHAAATTTIEWKWKVKPTGGFPLLLDGVDQYPLPEGASAEVALSYTPPPPTNKDYHVLAYQKTGTSSETKLKQAQKQQIPLARALDIGDRMERLLGPLRQATLLQTSTRSVADQTYFEYSLQADSLNYYISTSIVNTRLYVLVVSSSQPDKSLELVRSSFQVQSLQ